MSFFISNRGKILFMILFFVCLGMASEVFFTAMYAILVNKPIDGKPLLALAGMTYVWMALIYALIPILGVLFYDKVKHFKLYWRLLLYVLIIYLVEFTSGAILQVITGSCPWEYKEGCHILGLIRLDYFPAWVFFAWMVERLYVYVDKKVN